MEKAYDWFVGYHSGLCGQLVLFTKCTVLALFVGATYTFFSTSGEITTRTERAVAVLSAGELGLLGLFVMLLLVGHSIFAVTALTVPNWFRYAAIAFACLCAGSVIVGLALAGDGKDGIMLYPVTIGTIGAALAIYIAPFMHFQQ